MKTTQKIKFIVLISGTLLFTYLFWKQGFGLNFGIFNIFITSCVFGFYKDAVKSKPVILTLIGIFITSSMIVIYGSTLAFVMYLISVLLLIGFLHQPTLKLSLFAILSSVNDYFNSFRGMKKDFNPEHKTSKTSKAFFRFVKLAIVPVLILIIFFVIFRAANPVFNELTDIFFEKIGDFFQKFFEYISFGAILFTLWGFTIIAWIVFNHKNSYFQNIEQKFTEKIFRKKIARQKINFTDESKRNNPQIFNLKLSLKNEYRAAVMLVLMINFLLLVVNIIDIDWIWFGFVYDGTVNLMQFVHEGTYLLILSILLSMGIMLYFFRKNLNFYPKSEILKILSYIWIFQNAILAVSVMLRNYHYINNFDLAYKRIGLIVFLILVIFGLFTLFNKIRNQKSGYYLFRVNTWAAYLVMVIMTFANWDNIIAKYNLTSKNNDNIDVNFILKLSDNTLPVIIENRDIIFSNPENYDYTEEYNHKIIRFKNDYEKNTWQSWNYADYKAYNYILNFNTFTE